MIFLAEAVHELRPSCEFLVKDNTLIWLDDPALKPSDAEITVKINEIQLREEKDKKLKELKDEFDIEFKNTVGDVLFHEMVSWTVQEEEANMYLNDPVNAVTPFLDTLYNSRNPNGPDLDSSKEDLANKILMHANYYKTFYPSLLGKYQRLVDKINKANNILDVQSIVW